MEERSEEIIQFSTEQIYAGLEMFVAAAATAYRAKATGGQS